MYGLKPVHFNLTHYPRVSLRCTLGYSRFSLREKPGAPGFPDSVKSRIETAVERWLGNRGFVLPGLCRHRPSDTRLPCLNALEVSDQVNDSEIFVIRAQVAHSGEYGAPGRHLGRGVSR